MRAARTTQVDPSKLPQRISLFGLSTVPPAFLDLLHLQAGAAVDMAVDDGRLVVAPKPRPRYTLAELLAASDYSQPQPPDQREWVDAPAVGAEPL